MSDERTKPDESPAAEDDDSTVLELFGIDVRVKNPRLAEVLRMDAAEALHADVRDLMDPDADRRHREELREAVPDSMVSPPTPHDSHEAHVMHEMRGRVDAIGAMLEFDVSADGTWVSPSGVSVSVRTVSSDISFAAASDMIHKLQGFRKRDHDAEDAFLIVAPDQRGSDIVRVAVRQAGFHSDTRTLSLETLERIRGLVLDEEADHDTVLAWLVPAASVDVRAMLLDPAGSDRDVADPASAADRP